MKALLVALLLPLISGASFAQNRAVDSAQVAAVLTRLLQICKQADAGQTAAAGPELFSKAAPYVVYRGEDAARKWKDVADYSRPEEKEQVDRVCARIVRDVIRNTSAESPYRFLEYSSQKESEGTWHVIPVGYKAAGAERVTAFAFLRIKDRLALGDID